MINPQLITFITVAKNCSFSKAAEELFVSPTAVMKQINALEERLDIKLFLRTNRGLQLTEAGEGLLADALYVAEYSERALKKVREIDGKASVKTVRIGTSVMTPAKFLLDIWTNLQDKADKLKIELIPFENTPENSREILLNLGKHIDVVAGIYDDAFLGERGCAATRLDDKKICIAVPLSHELKPKEMISVSDLKGRKIMLIKKGWNKYIDELREFLTGNGTVIEDFEMFRLSAFNTAVTENLPIMTINGWENVHPLLKTVPVDWQFSVPYGILHSPSPSSQVEEFIKIVKDTTRS